ncbi:MAG TPA: hypothetical protein DCO89_03210 [Clostridiales bacterium]|nr:hypothetical protein [Clostridiales bacterium]
MKQQLSTRQSCLIIFIAMISTKLLSLNSIISYDMDNNAWFVFLMSFLIDFMFSLIFIYLIKKVDKPILEYIKEKFGIVLSTILSILIAIMFLMKTTQIMVDIYLFFVQLIYVEINRVVFVICFIVILLYYSSRYMQSIGRTIELLLFLILFSLVLSIVISFTQIKLDNLLPFLNINVIRTAKTTFIHNVWFGDFWFLFFMIGNVKIEKNTTKKLVWSYVISALVILIFTIIFTSVFGATASLHRVCVIDITEVTPRLINQARFNWLVDFTFPIALIIGLGLHANCVSICFKHVINNKLKSKTTIATILTTACVLAICVMFRFTFTSFYMFIKNYFCYANTIIQYVLPIILLVMIETNFSKNKQRRRLMYGKKNIA